MQAAAEKKERLAAEKKAVVDRQRDATRLANERSKKARDKSRAKFAERAVKPAPVNALNAVSLDASLESTPGAKVRQPTSTSGFDFSRVSQLHTAHAPCRVLYQVPMHPWLVGCLLDAGYRVLAIRCCVTGCAVTVL